MTDLAAFREKALAPLPGDSPCGIDAKFDSAYEAVVAQVRKLTSMSSAQDSVDFDVVVKNGTRLLMETTRDIVLSGYVCYGLLATEGYAGLAAGLTVYAGILGGCWDGLYPPPARMKARYNAIEWLSERVGDLVGSVAAKPADAEHVAAAAAAVEAIKATIRERFEGEKPSIAGLASAIEARVKTAAPPPSATPAAGAKPAASSSTPTVDAKAGTPAEMTEAIRRLSNRLRAADPTRALPYRVLRGLKWDDVASAPPAEDGRTLVPAPRGGIAGALASMHAAKDWTSLLAEAEDALTDVFGTFWLDLQRHVHAALVGLGPEYAVAADAVARATVAFVQRVPGVTEMTFDDGLPFADRETRAWLAEMTEALGGERKVVQVLVSPTARSAEKDRAELAPVKEKLDAGDLVAALHLLQDAIDSETSPKLRFLRRLDAARHCLDFGEPRWARPILEDLSREIGTATIAAWEPELARETERALVQCFRELAESAKKEEADPLIRQAEAARDRLFAQDLRLAAAATPRRK
jgi:type VI secretion system protein VasJ